jgi:hypothetical protein
MSLRFLHTSDWQLGMTRHFLSEGAQEKYSQARFDATSDHVDPSPVPEIQVWWLEEGKIALVIAEMQERAA